MQTVLVEGSIGLRAENGGQEIRMKPSQLGEYRRTDASLNVKNVDIEPYILLGKMVFLYLRIKRWSRL